MRILRLSLVLGGLFNLGMGSVFLHPELLKSFFSWAEWMEVQVFGRTGSLQVPSEPLHLMLIHGFGAAAVILGATLLYATRSPQRYSEFILIDGFGRLLYAGVMFYYTFAYSLIRTIFLFAAVEFAFAVVYIWFSWSRKWKMESGK